MAKDFLLKQVCPHHVSGEWLALDSNRKTLRPVKFPSSSQAKIVYNGITLPKSGLQSIVSIVGTMVGPYEIPPDTNEIKFSINNGQLQTVTIPIGRNVSTNAVVEAINTQAVDVRAYKSNGRLKLETLEAGPDETLFLQGGSAHKELGLHLNRFYYGRNIIPPWDVVTGDDPYYPEARFIQFERPIQGNPEDIFEVSYFTKSSECRRCNGLNFEHDIRHDSYGDPIFTFGIDLLAQEVEKIVFTMKGSNIFHAWYGTDLMSMIGSKITKHGSIIETQIVNAIGTTLDRYRNIKAQQARFQPVGDQEFLMKVKFISVDQDRYDPTIFRIKINIQNRSGQVDELTKNLAITDRQIVG